MKIISAVGLIVFFTGTLVEGRNIDKNNRELEYITNPFQREKCFGELGCFKTDDYFDAVHRFVNLVPADRESINTRFALYTRKNKPGTTPKPQFIRANDLDSIRNSDFNASKPTKVIIHGFLDTGFIKWINSMGNAILAVEDVNVIATDWSQGNGLPYTQATANTWVVGGEIALLLKFLAKNFGASLSRIHIIGHSLGAHIAGYASNRLGQQIDRITGLDPAEPYFQYMPEHVRLDHKDAKFVDVIHTDGRSIFELGFGMVQPVGHLDFYPNNGQDQPGCKMTQTITSIVTAGLQEGIRQFVACNHMRAIEIFTESILSGCHFIAHECDSYENYLKGKCNSCGANGAHCGKVGYYADTHPDKTGIINRKMYMTTGDKTPFCKTHYAVKLTVENDKKQNDQKVSMFVALHGEKATLTSAKLTPEPVYLQRGKSYSFVVGSTKLLGKVTSADFHYKTEWSMIEPGYWSTANLYLSKLTVEPIDVLTIDDEQLPETSIACRKDKTIPIKNKQSVTFRKSNC